MLLLLSSGGLLLSKQEKLLQQIRNNPKNVRFETIQKILINYGFTESKPRGGSSHYTYHKGIYRVTLPKNNPVNSIYIKLVLNIIDKLEVES
jgi:predicted RNA binding protein YcfA (HicA-like mRNA interferase family)